MPDTKSEQQQLIKHCTFSSNMEGSIKYLTFGAFQVGIRFTLEKILKSAPCRCKHLVWCKILHKMYNRNLELFVLPLTCML